MESEAEPVVVQLSIGPMDNFVYLIADQATSACAVIDPGWEPETIIHAAAKRGWSIAKILLTHTHYDHAREAAALARETGAEVYVHETESSKLPGDVKVQVTKDGTTVSLGRHQLEVLHTPGHTPGSQCFLLDGELFTGDTLFVDACGRVDLPGGSPAQMRASLARLARLDPATVVHPGHHYGPTPTSTIGQQLRTNPYIRNAVRAADRR